MPNVSIVWDFDKTLCPVDSTTVAVEYLTGKNGKEFWDLIKYYGGNDKTPKNWEHILASDAPTWMYVLSELAYANKVPLNSEFFSKFIKPNIDLYPNCIEFLSSIKRIEDTPEFQSLNLQIHHFVVSAGLKDLVELFFPQDVVRMVFGCRYTITAIEGKEDYPKSIPIFCMDETMKTRSLFEISKGSFQNQNQQVNKRIEKKNLWSPFENFIYIGDGPTDIPALSLTRDRGGMGVVVYDPKSQPMDVNKRIKDMRLDRRADLITKADFSVESELYSFLASRIIQIKQRYEAESI